MAELLSTAETLALTREQIGDRLAILTNGAAGVPATDALMAPGGHLATLSKETISASDRLLPASWSRGNPVDIPGDASGKRYPDTLAVLIGDREVDAILALNCPTGLAQPDEAARAVIGALKAAEPTALRGRDVITAWFGEDTARPARQLFADARMPPTKARTATSALVNRVRHRDNQELLTETPPVRTDAFEKDSASVRRVVTAAIAAKNPGSTRWKSASSSQLTVFGLSTATLPRIPQAPRRLLRALVSLSPSRSAV
jgi:acetyltransferase